jgi:hypothetical protein
VSNVLDVTYSALLLPLDPLNERSVDDSFRRDRDAARELELRTLVLDHDRLVGSERAVSIRGLADAEASMLYRGWMIPAAAYEALEAAVVAQGSSLITTAAQYISAHHLPGWIEIFKELTPATTFVPVNATPDDVVGAATALGGTAFVVKDWVKSRKYEWDTAAFAPTLESLPGIVAEFIRLQEEFFVGEVVIRRFVDLDKSQPEIRVWWARGAIALISPHPDFSGASLPVIDEAFLERVRKAVVELDSPFVTTDLAMTSDLEWLVIEVGDGQVSGLPDSAGQEEIKSILSAILEL